MRTKPMQLSVVAVAALAIVAVAAAMLLAGGGPAQADTASHAPDGGGHLWPEQATPGGDGTPTPEPTPEPTQQTEPEECQTPTASVVSSGHYALFDVYWDAEDKNLVNNPCPPTVTLGPDGTITRAASNADIGATVFHIPGAADLTLRANDVEAAAEWPFLYPDRVEDDEGAITSAGTPLGRLVDPTPDDPDSGDETYQVWTLPKCSHDATSAPSPDDLCIGFSAALLNASDWNGDVQYEFESFRQNLRTNPGEVFVFYNVGDTPDGEKRVTWRTDDADTNELLVTPGEYEHRRWAFSKPGTYVFQVHLKGHPSHVRGGPVDTRATTATSEVPRYTFHVGLLADLSVTVPRVSDTTPHTGGSVTFDVRVSNAGPDVATNTKVEITLPDGLTYDAADATAGTYDSATRVWSVGDLASGAHQDLGLRVNVADDTHGVPQTLTARVYATEQIESQVVQELDPRAGDNSAASTVTPTARPNVNPTFFTELSVAEDAASGSTVGQPVRVKEPDAGNTLTFNLTGDGAVDFTVSSVDGGAQIAVGPASLDYESIASYDLTLEVSDGLDANGNADPSVDDTLPVTINVTDVENEGVTATLQASPANLSAGEEATFTLTVGGLPEGVQPTAYFLVTHGGEFGPTTTTPAVTWDIACAGAGGAKDFVARVRYQDGEGADQNVLSNRVTVSWTSNVGERTICNARRSGGN